MAIDQKYIEWLYRSLDGELSPQEEQALQQALQDSAELRREQEQVLRLRRILSSFQPIAEEAFTLRVLNGLQEEAVPAHWLRKIAAACLLLIASAFTGLYLTEGNLSQDTLIGVEELQPEDATALTSYSELNQ